MIYTHNSVDYYNLSEKLDGKHIIYYESSNRVRIVVNIQHGKANGSVKFYDDDSKIVRHEMFKNGFLKGLQPKKKGCLFYHFHF